MILRMVIKEFGYLDLIAYLLNKEEGDKFKISLRRLEEIGKKLEKTEIPGYQFYAGIAGVDGISVELLESYFKKAIKVKDEIIEINKDDIQVRLFIDLFLTEEGLVEELNQIVVV